MGQQRALTESEAAQRLGISGATLRNWRRLSKGPAFRKFGRNIRYLEHDLDAYMTESVEDAGGRSKRNQG